MRILDKINPESQRQRITFPSMHNFIIINTMFSSLKKVNKNEILRIILIYYILYKIIFTWSSIKSNIYLMHAGKSPLSPEVEKITSSKSWMNFWRVPFIVNNLQQCFELRWNMRQFFRYFAFSLVIIFIIIHISTLLNRYLVFSTKYTMRKIIIYGKTNRIQTKHITKSISFLSLAK